MPQTKGFLKRLEDGENIIIAEGYLFEFEERGYLKAGGFVPEVVLEHPDLVRQLHREYVHAGSDVVLAFTYYGHREKLRLIGREGDLERLNRDALRIAREVADETGTLMAGNISNTTIYKPNDAEIDKKVYAIFKEQIEWAVEGGADFIIGETYGNAGEAMLALKAIKEFGKGLPAMICLVYSKYGIEDDVPFAEICRKLEKEGAAVVGINCGRGPRTILPPLRELRKICKCPIAALPVPYRTSEEHPTFQSLDDIDNPDKSAFPQNLDAWRCTRSQIVEFGEATKEIGVQVVGLCCGNKSHLTRALAESLGRSPPASRYSPDMSLHYSRLQDDAHSHTTATFSKQYKK